MKALFRDVWMEEGGQDLIEYSLLLAFVCLASAALLTENGRSVLSIWNKTQTRMEAADGGIPN